jgi:hypothetical protein
METTEIVAAAAAIRNSEGLVGWFRLQLNQVQIHIPL